MKHLYLVIGIVCSCLSASVAQPVQGCATEVTQEQYEYLTSLRSERQNFSSEHFRGQMNMVPMQIHILRPSNGKGGITEAIVKEELENINEYYRPAKIEFYLSGPLNFIDNDKYYDFNTTYEGELTEKHEKANVINIYYTGDLKSKNGYQMCGYTYMPKGKDRIFINKSCTSEGSTLAHEMGHYFSLYHTHGTTYNDKELVNGSNCGASGDEICDTPADPNLSGKVDQNCLYTGSLTDPEGNAYQPDTKNIMSYSFGTCRSYFTQQQYDRILFSYLSDRNYLYSEDTFHLQVNADKDLISMEVYPNPTAGHLHIQLFENSNENISVAVYDVAGRAVYREDNKDYTGSGVSIDLSGLDKGIYFVNVIADNRSLTKRILLR